MNEGPAIVNPEPPALGVSVKTFHEHVAEIALQWPDQVAVIDDVGIHLWRDVFETAVKIFRGLSASGVRPGDKVACLMRNRWLWLSSLLGTSMAGAVYVPLNTWYKQAELKWTLAQTAAVALLSEDSFLGHDWAVDLEEIEPALLRSHPGDVAGTNLPALKTVAYVGDLHPGAYTWESFLRLGEGAAGTGDAVTPPVQSDDPVMILYTSGSTGTPKGVILNHRTVLANGMANGARRGIVPGDRIWLGSPLFYGLGAANVVPMAIMTRASLVLQDRFDPEHALDVIERHACNVFYGTSNMIRRIYESPRYRRERVSSLDKGSAGIESTERRLLLEEMGVEQACTAFGATELSGMCFVSDPDDDVATKVEYSGYPLPGFEAQIVDPASLLPLPPGEIGLLKVRGLTALGYFNDPGRTSEAFDDDGYYWTGDLGWFNERGYFRWHSRAGDMIKSGGINLAPAEIESLLLSHVGVSEAHVIGVPDRVKGECAVAFVVAQGNVDERLLKEHVRENAASFKVPAHIILMQAADIPRTASSKVAKSELRQLWSAMAKP